MTLRMGPASTRPHALLGGTSLPLGITLFL